MELHEAKVAGESEWIMKRFVMKVERGKGVSRYILPYHLIQFFFPPALYGVRDKQGPQQSLSLNVAIRNEWDGLLFTRINRTEPMK